MVEPQASGSAPTVDGTEISVGPQIDVQRDPSPVPSSRSGSDSWYTRPYVDGQIEDDPDDTESLRGPPPFFLGSLYIRISNLDPASQAFHYTPANM